MPIYILAFQSGFQTLLAPGIVTLIMSEFSSFSDSFLICIFWSISGSIFDGRALQIFRALSMFTSFDFFDFPLYHPEGCHYLPQIMHCLFSTRGIPEAPRGISSPSSSSRPWTGAIRMLLHLLPLFPVSRGPLDFSVQHEVSWKPLFYISDHFVVFRWELNSGPSDWMLDGNNLTTSFLIVELFCIGGARKGSRITEVNFLNNFICFLWHLFVCVPVIEFVLLHEAFLWFPFYQLIL